MLMTAILKDNGLFIPNIDKKIWEKQMDKDGLLQVDIVPMQSSPTVTTKKNSHAGILSQYANSDLIPLEEKAVEMAISEKYGVN